MRSIDPARLPKHFEATRVEARWDEQWQASGVYHYDASRSREETFVVDTPPPTASGSLHIGHVFSYTHADVVVRYKRMTGMNIFYPMGWDDNGLPTERRVQNLLGIRCDPKLPYDPDWKPVKKGKKDKKEEEAKEGPGTHMPKGSGGGKGETREGGPPVCGGCNGRSPAL